MGDIVYIHERELSNSIVGKTFSSVRVLRNIEDIATLLEVFENAILDISVDSIVDVLCNSEGSYVFLVNDSINKFDLFRYINSKYKGDTVVSCINAKLAFPKSRSRGIYTYVEGYIDEEETPTGFLGDDIDDLVPVTKHYVIYPKTGEQREITSSGIIVGRSSAQSDFVIRGNANLSRVHCSIMNKDNCIIVEDLNSANGTYVKNRKLSGESINVNVGDSIFIAGEELVIQ